MSQGLQCLCSPRNRNLSIPLHYFIVPLMNKHRGGWCGGCSARAEAELEFPAGHGEAHWLWVNVVLFKGSFSDQINNAFEKQSSRNLMISPHRTYLNCSLTIPSPL
ncbi:hypothetical protein V2G26_015655 [Clonostachys chloroleuca]